MPKPRKHLVGLSAGAPGRLAPPAELTPGARAAFIQTVQSVAADHFSRVDLPLLVMYAQAVELGAEAAAAIARDGAVVDGRANPYVAIQEKAIRAAVALSARLRVCPQSRFDRLKAGVAARGAAGMTLENLRANYATEGEDE